MRLILAIQPGPGIREAVRREAARGDVFTARDFLLVVRFTRHWIHYGFFAHTVLCILIAAMEGVLSR